ncbi:MAG: S8 family serine peptidase [Gemmatimonadota bacterium]
MNRRSCTSLLLVSIAAGACVDAGAPAGPARLAPFIEVSGDITTQLVPNEYIVILRDGARSDLNGAVAQVSANGGKLLARYDHVFRGYAARLSSDQLTMVRQNPEVLLVQPNGIVTISGTQAPTPSWGLDRIDQRNLPLDNSFTYGNDGTGVHEYTIDTGILLTHSDFAGRVGNGFDAITSGGTANDCNGHGSHVTGTAAGTTYGIAKKATVHPVRVLDCSGSGSFAQVIAGMNWVTANRIQPAVANMSLGGGKDVATNMAADSMVRKGNVALAVASGNSSANACNSSPASAPLPLTVNATTIGDARASFSNFGTCTDLFAPGVNITSDWIGSNNATNTISGTSMATPHVTGALALYRAANPGMTAEQIFTKLLADATPNKVTNPGTGSPNKLLYIGNLGGGPPPPPNQPPVAGFTWNCSANPNGTFRCDFDGSNSTDDNGVTAYLWQSAGKPDKSGVTNNWRFDAGTYDVTLTVTDAGGLSNSITKSITVGGPPPPPPPTNVAPVAAFSYSCTVRPNGKSRCAFDGSSSTDDVGVVAYLWTVSGEPSQNGPNAAFGFDAGATNAVTLKVTDGGGLTNSITKTITVP